MEWVVGFAFPVEGGEGALSQQMFTDDGLHNVLWRTRNTLSFPRNRAGTSDMTQMSGK